MSDRTPLVAQAREALREIVDPELGVNLVDLGLIEALQERPEGLYVRMTLTSAACPVEEALEALLPPPQQLELELVFAPPWTPARLSAAAREQLGWEQGA